MDSPAESHNSTEFWGTESCRMSGSIWKGLRESSCPSVLAVGSWLTADSINLNADVVYSCCWPALELQTLLSYS